MAADLFLFESAASTFTATLAAIAQNEHDTYCRFKEKQQPLSDQIKRYWSEFNLAPSGLPWSGVFISWCVKKAGATKAEFPFSAKHAVYVYKLIQNALQQKGVFRAYPIDTYAPQIGDIIQNSRNGNRTYAYAAKNWDYDSHCAIVVSRGADVKGPFVVTVGGNESDSVRCRRVPLHPSGLIIQKQTNAFISVIQCLK